VSPADGSEAVLRGVRLLARLSKAGVATRAEQPVPMPPMFGGRFTKGNGLSTTL
jgi:hypothetical protein